MSRVRRLIVLIICLLLLSGCQPMPFDPSLDDIEPAMQQISTTIAQYVDDLLIKKKLLNNNDYELMACDYPLVVAASYIAFHAPSEGKCLASSYGCKIVDNEVILGPCLDGKTDDTQYKRYHEHPDMIHVNGYGFFSYPRLQDNDVIAHNIHMDITQLLNYEAIHDHLLGLYILTPIGETCTLTEDCLDYTSADKMVNFDDRIVWTFRYGNLFSGSVPIENVGELRYVIATKSK